jgi:pyridoxine 5-phosphate synthase
MSEIAQPLNLEMAMTDEMLEIALNHRPNACCIVPENRLELTTEGGLDAVSLGNRLPVYIAQLKNAGIRVSLFIDPDISQIEASAAESADIVELHTGPYCEAALEGNRSKVSAEIDRLAQCARAAADAGLEVHAGHGLTFDTVAALAAMPEIVELNIGHFLIGEAIFGGLHSTIGRMRALMDNARAEANGCASA